MTEPKIAILTQPLGHNYGGLLQAYALQTYLKKIGARVETLDRRQKKTKLQKGKKLITELVKFATGQIKSLPTKKRQEWVFSELIEFRDRKIEMSPKMEDERELRAYYRERDFDIFLVGSDQVWRPCYSPSILNYYLDFLDDIKSPARRIAYGVSFGVDEWEYSDHLTGKCRTLAQKFNAVSVRELSGVDLCKNKLNVSAKCVVDPTLLLEVEDYESLIEQCVGEKHVGGLLLYILDPEPRSRAIADIVSVSRGIDIFSIKPHRQIEKVPVRDRAKFQLPSVEYWLKAFNDASFIVTDSFHGTVFSILFNKPFIVVGNKVRGMARFQSFLSQMGLTERLVESPTEVSSKLINSEIDWDAVNRKKTVLAEAGRNFLDTYILNH
ncbi:polysaccharide pyruvyl transferase family protein [Marinobacter sp. MMG032]|uniref:Polysaccharide pyruvyl transferase family protein n=1 Tax=Marinobacter sp. MMG032 TaxID=3158548 RepID=A0AAU7MKY5_9GAMM